MPNNRNRQPPSAIPIVLASDDRFRIGMLATVRSITQNLSPDHHLEVHVLDCGLSDADEVKGTLERNAECPIDVQVHPVPLEQLHQFDLNRPKLSAAAFARLLAPTLLPHLDRVIYLDSDLLITGDLATLWAEDLKGQPLGGVPDSHFVFLGQDVSNCRELGVSPFHRYFGSGVLLVDLRQWREEQVEQELVKLGEPGRLQRRFNDQSILNFFFAGRVRFLPRRWNQLRFHWNQSAAYLPPQRGIVHIGGSPKPWQFPAEGAVGVNALYHQVMRGAEVPEGWLPRPEETHPSRDLRGAFRSAKLTFRSTPLGMINALPFVLRSLRERDDHPGGGDKGAHLGPRSSGAQA